MNFYHLNSICWKEIYDCPAQSALVCVLRYKTETDKEKVLHFEISFRLRFVETKRGCFILWLIIKHHKVCNKRVHNQFNK